MLGFAADVLPGDPQRDLLPRRGLHPLLAGVPRPALLPRPHPPRVEPQVSPGRHTEDKWWNHECSPRSLQKSYGVSIFLLRFLTHNCCIETFRAFVTTHIGGAYFYIHDHYCLHALAWDSPASWVLAGLGIDFCFYWVHRAGHGQQYVQGVSL